MAPDWIDPDIEDNPWSKLLTLRMCLSHRTGFANWRYQTKNVLTFQWEPGTKTGYSGEGFDYAARFAERKTGRPWEELAQQYVFDPAGMRTPRTRRALVDRSPGQARRSRQPHQSGRAPLYSALQ